MIDARVFLHQPVNFNQICNLYPPTVNDIVNQPQLFQAEQLLTQTAEDIEDLFENIEGKVPTPFEFVLLQTYHTKGFKELIENFFSVICHEPITFMYNQKIIFIGDTNKLAQVTDLSKVKYLSEDNFFEFQNLIRLVFGQEQVEPPDPNENEMVKSIKRKARRGRKKSKDSGKGINFSASLCAICCMNLGLTPLNIGEISYAAVSALISMYQQKEKYQIDMDSILAGADPKKVKPKYWIRDKSDSVDVQV